jgi:hypothetical protein
MPTRIFSFLGPITSRHARAVISQEKTAMRIFIDTLKRADPPYLPREYPLPLIEVVELGEVVGRVVIVDLMAALAGERGAVLRLANEGER